MRKAMTACVLAGGLAIGAGAPAAADPVEDFYKGRQVNLVIGYSPGGGYDVYARVLGRHIGRYIPGNPNIVIQNMPGAGSLVAANWLYGVAARDGSVFGGFSRTASVLALLPGNTKAKFDPMKFTWLGTISSYATDAYALMVRKDAKASTIAALKDMTGPPLILGSTADGASSDAIPTVLRELAGLNVKAVSGYKDSSVLFLAVDRGEVEGRTVGLSAMRSSKADWLAANGPMRLLVVLGRRTRHTDYPDAPTLRELAKGPLELSLIEALEVPYLMSKPYVAPPGVPADRAKALQAAFMAVHKDKDYLAESEKVGNDISPLGPDEIMKILDQISKLPPEVIARVEKLLE